MQRLFSLRFSVDHVRFILEAISSHNHKSAMDPNYQHSHASYDLHYMVTGSSRMDSAGRRYSLEAGQMLLIPPNIPHRFVDFSKEFVKIDLSFLLLPPAKENFDETNLKFYRAFQQEGIIVFDLTTPDMASLSASLQQLHTYALNTQDSSFIYQHKTMALASLLMMDLFSALSDESLHSVPGEHTRMSQSYIIDQFFSYNYNASKTRQQLAKLLNVSPRHLNRLLQQQYGMSYQEKVKQIRLETAMELLSTSAKSIAEISEVLGYSSPSNFSIFIKNETGKTPSEIRSNQTEPEPNN